MLAATDRPTGLYGHVWSVAGVTDHTWALAILCVLGLAVFIRALWREDRAGAALGAAYAATAASTAVTLAATAVWDHHAQMLAAPGFLLIALLADAVERLEWPDWIRVATAAGATLASLAAFGAFAEPPGIANGAGWRDGGHSALADALEEADPDGHTSYAVLGRNTERAHAAFLDDGWRLACPRFHQYPYSPRLDEVVACIDERRPRLVLVTVPLGGDASLPPAWSRFAADATALLHRRYRRVNGTGTGGAGVWRLRTPAYAPAS